MAQVIVSKLTELWCHRQGSGRYTLDWIFSYITIPDRSVFVKTDAEKKKLKLLKG